MGLVGLCLVLLVLIIAGSVKKAGRGVVVGFLLGLGKNASVGFLDLLLLLFQYPPRSARALLAGTLPLRYCTARSVSRIPTWRLPVSGHVASLVCADLGVSEGDGVEDARREVHWVSGSGLGRKRIRLNRKNPAHLAGLGAQSWPRVWKRLRHVEHSLVSIP